MDHQYFMKKALSLASKGRGRTSPNPMVGALLVKNGVIKGRGYHRKYGSIHAEIEAFSDAEKREAGIDFSDGTVLYTTLEPCCHRTETKINPPCCEKIIREGIKEVVIASVDPNPLVNGKGIYTLEKNGIKVTKGILEKEEKKLNRIYHYCAANPFPFIHLKLAQSIDGFIAGENRRWISNKESRKTVHRWRGEYDAVLVGSGTVIADNPELTVRGVRGNQPKRLVLDTSLKTPPGSNLTDDCYSHLTHIFFNPESTSDDKIKEFSKRKFSIHPVPADRSGKLSLDDVFKITVRLGIKSVLAEGGSILASELIREKAVNRISFFIAPDLFFSGVPSFRFHSGMNCHLKLEDPEFKIIGDNILISGDINFRERI